MDDTARDLAKDIHQFLNDVDNPQAVYNKMQAGEFDEAFAMMGLTRNQAESIARSWHTRIRTILRQTVRD
ncbi:hypothetical protein [Halalkalicoccus jeotgali]|uniref:Uncharacterized protein n=1 Tax=Halalkalicoccus jeotgali (strain DSM 18796 / CECT 7217 / JCM 14584 / KCTC 4019 / B3) TaxID=795797 RepID=D8JDA4_HALJB|nr:hypothetical protein [Halalkalicoccus jeotgali]ADJ17257.1 hypothetical protein HacjB3_19608 [Halalkalicoccus jeotgali B3]ELY41944.1 hypothetical protein C497_00040 [Halalkalicoccus jeotgali B3]